MSETIDRSYKFYWDLEDIEIEEPERKPETGMKTLTSALSKQKQPPTEVAKSAT